MPDDPKSKSSRHFRPDHRGRSRLPVSLVVIAILIALLALVRPSRLPMHVNPGSVMLPAATEHPTIPPRPTDVHGGQIVFTCTRQQINQICIIRADGTGYRQLTTGNSNSYFPAISPDGRDVIFATNQYDTFDLYRLSPEVEEGQRQSRSRLKRLTDYIGNAYSPSFSPDGRQVIFVNRVGEGPAGLWLMGGDGEDPHPIFGSSRDVVSTAWSPDGMQVAFAMAAERAFEYDMYLLNISDLSAPPQRIPSQIADMGGSISWSPDQNDLLIFAGPAAAREIYRLELATGAATRLTFGGNNASASYSPDGQYIVFNSMRTGGQADLYIMRSDGHSMRRLTDHPEPDWQPRWGP